LKVLLNLHQHINILEGHDEYNKKRAPAYCDRILWVKSPHPCININQEIYTSSLTTPNESDHRPVFSEYNIIYNDLWKPELNSQWLISFKNLYLYLDELDSHTDILKGHRTSLTNIKSSNHSLSHSSFNNKMKPTNISPYLTLHSPMLQTIMRTTVGKRIDPLNNINKDNNNETITSDISINNSLIYKFSINQFIIKIFEWLSLGNGCLWVVIRDDNLMGDVDVIGGTSIPLIDTNKFKYNNHKNKNDYIYFSRDITLSTSKKGHLQGQIKCECFMDQ